MIGYNAGFENVLNSYWDIEATGQESSAGGEGRTSSQMKNAGTYNQWDFAETWDIHPSINSGYPYLRFMYPEPDGG